MLTAKENMLEVIRGGNPDRFVNQYEAVRLMFHPYLNHMNSPLPGEENKVNAWGVTNSWPVGAPGFFPVHTPEKIVLKDIENWKDYVKAPTLDFPQGEWDMAKEEFDKIDGTKAFKALFITPGLFEMTHHLAEITNAMIYLIEYEDEMHDLIKYLTETELRVAELCCEKLHPDALFHHDDWGSENSTFMSPAMFEDFFLDAYKQIYGYYHAHGVDVVIHHSDSFAATLVPDMIEMGIDVWQGPMRSNNVPELIKKYGGKISFMGNIDDKLVDFEGYTYDDCYKAAKESMESCGINYYIPCKCQGAPGGSAYAGSYETLCKAIDDLNREKFGISGEDARVPWQIF